MVTRPSILSASQIMFVKKDLHAEDVDFSEGVSAYLNREKLGFVLLRGEC